MTMYTKKLDATQKRLAKERDALRDQISEIEAHFESVCEALDEIEMAKDHIESAAEALSQYQ